MDWGKVVYVFFTLMSLTSTAGFLFGSTFCSGESKPGLYDLETGCT